ncbi:MAG TPA: hypothetical protein VHN14_27730 [Kofleriaceae bacterium]|jgi:tetratricopeptide (TPR) repeat protein|nr:hypothetical protein [Kofleriaceae bacterium]
MIRRGAVRAVMLAVAAVSIAGAVETADAKPKRRDAKAEFTRGVEAYQKGDFDTASAALGKSFELERDLDTLFAWAQAERKLEHCDKAIDLYEKLLGFKLPAANKDAVEQKLAECRAIIAQQKPPGEPATADAKPGPVESVAPPPVVNPSASATTATATSSTGRPWYKDPVALGLIGAGVVAGGLGAGLSLTAKSWGDDFKGAKTYQDALGLKDKANKADRYGTIGAISIGAGSALVVGGVVWIVTHRHATEQPPVTGWLAPSGGGFAVSGAF